VAAALLRPELAGEASVTSADFLDSRLGDIWATMEALRADGETVDIGTVAAASRQSDLVLEVAAAVPTGENIRFYGQQVRDASLRRRLLVDVDEALRTEESGRDLHAALTRVLQRSRPATGRHGTEMREGLLRTLTAIEGRYNEGGRPLGVRTGLSELDRLTGGLPIGVPFIVGGRPGDGKSALALTMALGAAGYGAVVDIWSLEDSAEVVRERALAQRSGLDLMAVRQGALRAAEWNTLSQAAGELAQVFPDRGGTGRIMVDDGVPKSVEVLAQAMEASAGRRGTTLAIVDYLQLLRAPSMRTRSRNDEIAYCLSVLGGVARRCRLALLLCAQLRRDVEEAAQPRLSHLRECGQIEQDARGALLLERRHGLCDQYGASLDSIAVAWLEKNTHGPAPKRFPLHWEAKCVRFGDASEEEERAWRSADSERKQGARRR
jgi:replicative DNA helicase